MKLFRNVQHIHTRRSFLKSQFNISQSFEKLEESCVPSYCHGNLAAAYVAWWRLFVAVRLVDKNWPAGPVLDFGASVGELSHLLPPSRQYHFVENDDALAQRLQDFVPNAQRISFDRLPRRHYAVAFALDSLEHNSDPGKLIDGIAASLTPDGIFVISGPTENWLYRLGRKLAGFSGHYHTTNIYNIEALMRGRMVHRQSIRGPGPLPLFGVSAWVFGETEA